MKFHAVVLLLLVSSLSWAQGRKPAVEDFVGIEVEHPETVTPHGTESLFNLEKDMNKVAQGPELKTPVATKAGHIPLSWDFTTIFTVAFLLGLPLCSWMWAMNRMKKNAYEQTASNIKVLEEYRKEREAKKKTEEQRKAS